MQPNNPILRDLPEWNEAYIHKPVTQMFTVICVTETIQMPFSGYMMIFTVEYITFHQEKISMKNSD